jgi:hypothetical protein
MAPVLIQSNTSNMGCFSTVSDDEQGEEIVEETYDEDEEYYEDEEYEDHGNYEEGPVTQNPSSIDFFTEILSLPVEATFVIFSDYKDEVYSLSGKILSIIEGCSTVEVCFQEEDDYCHNVGNGVMTVKDVHSVSFTEWKDKYDMCFNPSASSIVENFTNPSPKRFLIYRYELPNGEKGKNEWTIPKQ